VHPPCIQHSVTARWSKEGTVRHCQSKEASILWSHHDETRELLGKRDNTRKNARCTQARWMDNISRWTVLPVEETVSMTEDKDSWRSTSMVLPTLRLRMAKEQNS